jgi:DNA-binding CsgD family transcriptional regulator
MCAQGLTLQQEARATGWTTEAEVLIRQLVHLTASRNDSVIMADSEGRTEEVCLDVKIDGFRCMLIRVHPSAVIVKMVLSPREQEIARMIAEGYPNKTIAAILDISSWTVGTHLRRVFAKLGVGTRAAMVARVLDDGLLQTKIPEPYEVSAHGHRLSGTFPRKQSGR